MKKTKPKDYGLAEVFGITEVMQKLDKLTESFEEIKERLSERVIRKNRTTEVELAEPAYDPNWRAEAGGRYWHITDNGFIGESAENRDYTDDYLHATNNYYRSKEEAKRIGIPKHDKALALARIEKFIYANRLQIPDGYNGERFVFYLCDNLINIRGKIYDVFLDPLQFSSQAHADWVDRVHEADLKILFGIK